MSAVKKNKSRRMVRRAARKRAVRQPSTAKHDAMSACDRNHGQGKGR